MKLRAPSGCAWTMNTASATRRRSPANTCRQALTAALSLALAGPLCAQRPPAGPEPLETQEPRALPGGAGTLRDPTQVPVALQSAEASTREADGGDAVSAPRVVLRAGGRSYVLSAGRRYGVGDTWGDARIARITPQEVWLESGGAIRREPVYPGVHKRPTVQPAAEAARPAKPQRPSGHRQEKP
jgi:hypothetical protein